MTLPEAVYSRAQVQAIDNSAIHTHHQTDLMQRAGQATLALCQRVCPQLRTLCVLCGPGNNGGDGLVVATLAHQQGIAVMTVCLASPQQYQHDAAQAWLAHQAAGVPFCSWSALAAPVEPYDCIVDALFGSGLQRNLSDDYLAAIAWINRQQTTIISVDLPSGLDADTGQCLGDVVCADATLTFIGLKQGQFTPNGRHYCGALYFDDLAVPHVCYADQRPVFRRYDRQQLRTYFPRRPWNTHKGHYGHVFVVGGNRGMAGAVGLTALAALRSGCGRVTVLTHPDNQVVVHGFAQELMCVSVAEGDALPQQLAQASVIAIGPGLGTDAWAQHIWAAIRAMHCPLVIDADALNLLCLCPQPMPHAILTPHPGEAARLLSQASRAVQADRHAALQALVARFQTAVVLKGAGTLIGAPTTTTVYCDAGNPGMATAGMGDVLTGVIASLLAQGFSQWDAACLGAIVHACAGDAAALMGERGLIASDLIAFLRDVVNPC